VFDHRGEAFDPVSAVVVGDPFDLAHGGRVDVTAEDRIDTVVAREPNDGFLEFSNEAHDIFDLGFHVGAEGPVAEPEEPTEEIDDAIAAQEQHIAYVPEVGQPAEVLDDGIEFMPMDDEDLSAVCRGVDRVLADFDAGVVPVEGGEEFVVVARNVNDLSAFAALAEEFLNHIVVILRPIDSATKSPDINQIADKVECLKFRIPEKIDQGAGIAALGSQMHI
jgi:hypothetical protein